MPSHQGWPGQSTEAVGIGQIPASGHCWHFPRHTGANNVDEEVIPIPLSGESVSETLEDVKTWHGSEWRVKETHLAGDHTSTLGQRQGPWTSQAVS